MPLLPISRSAAAGLCAIAWMTTLGFGAIAAPRQDSAQLLRLKYHEGKITKYQMNMTVKIDMEGMPAGVTAGAGFSKPIEMQSRVKQVVLHVFPDGSAKIKSVVTPVKKPAAGAGGGMININASGGANKPIIAVIDPRGAVKEVEGLPKDNKFSSAFTRMFGGATPFVFLPENPVSPGDTWQSPIDIKGLSTGGTVDSTLVRFDNVGGHQIAVITYVINMPLQMDPSMLGAGGAGAQGLSASGTLAGNGAAHLDLTAGNISFTDVDAKMNMSLAFAAGTPGAQQLPNGIKLGAKMHVKMHETP